MYFMLELTEGEQVAAELQVHGDYIGRPEKARDAMRRLRTAIEADGHKLIGMRPISRREYRAFVKKYDKGDTEVVRF